MKEINFFKRNLRYYRIKKSERITDAAKGIGISVSYYSALENPDSPKMPSLKMLQRIAAYYNISSDMLIAKEMIDPALQKKFVDNEVLL